jgi:signal transduction histidine kinase
VATLYASKGFSAKKYTPSHLSALVSEGRRHPLANASDRRVRLSSLSHFEEGEISRLGTPDQHALFETRQGAPEDIEAETFEDALADISAAFVRATADQISNELERWLKRIGLALGIDRSTIAQIDPNDGLLYTSHRWAREGVTPMAPRTKADDTLPWVTQKLLAGETISLDDVENAPSEAAKDLEYARLIGIKSVMIVPLRIGGVIVGALGFDAVFRARAWSPRTARRLRLVAEVFGNALERERAVAEINRLREEMRQTSRVAMTGELTASLAHELNQPLAAILNNAEAARQMLAAKRPNLAEVREAIDEIIQDNSRAVETLRTVRALFQRDQIQMAPLDLRQVLLEVERILQLEAISRNIALRLDFPPSLPSITGNRTQLVELLMNLTANAFDSVSEHGGERREVELRAHQPEAQRVNVAVRDTGGGIDPDLMPQLFKAFFTTKPKGMGMGLAIARSIVETHGGRLWATSNTGGGATLEFQLPVSAHEENRQ